MLLCSICIHAWWWDGPCRLAVTKNWLKMLCVWLWLDGVPQLACCIIVIEAANIQAEHIGNSWSNLG